MLYNTLCPVNPFNPTFSTTSDGVFPTDLPLLLGDDMYDSDGTRPVYNLSTERRNSSCPCPGSVAEAGQGIQVAYYSWGFLASWDILATWI